MLSIHEMLTRSAHDRPGKEAIVSRARRVTFSDLDEASKRIAHFLRSRGLEDGMRVAIYSSKCAEEAALIFGIAEAGCVLVHVNPSFRDQQLQHVIQECEPAALFFHPSKGAMVERAARDGVLPNLLISIASRSDRAFRPPALDLADVLSEPATDLPRTRWTTEADDLAAIVYTSGTTARAKGIIVTHGILSESTLVSAEILGNTPTDRLISVTPFSFDGALSQLFTAMLVGGTLVLQDSHFPKDVVRTLISERITGIHAVPSFWRLILDRSPSFADHEFPHLRYVSLIGEVFPEDELARLRSILKTTDFFMMYGTTEAFRSTCLAPADLAVKSRSVGKPLPGVEISVLDEEGRSCPPGVVGEIVHAGAFVSPGYWRRNGDATFREDGVHTGDLGMLDEDGYLYFVGRKDTMVKRVGYQVYPEEIEAFLREMDGVATAAVVGAPDQVGDSRLCAFLVPGPGYELTREAVIKHCRRHLPYYMMPDEIAFRSTLPTTGSGKIDRARLLMKGTA